MMEQHITRVSEAREESVGMGCDHGPPVALVNPLQHSVNGLGLARAASTVHSLRRTSKTDPFSAGKGSIKPLKTVCLEAQFMWSILRYERTYRYRSGVRMT
jgi:hypothetical protein